MKTIDQLPIITMPISQFKSLVLAGEFWAGTHMLTMNGEAKGLNNGIAWAQGCALKDLGGATDAQVEAARHYTHAAVLYDEDHIAELYRPKARFRELRKLVGYRVALVLPREEAFIPTGKSPEDVMELVANRAGEAVMRGDRYPVKELLYYLKYVTKRWRRIIPFWRDRSFFEMFKDHRYNVCSGAVWQWDRQAGLFADASGTNDEFPEAWYPARFLVDRRFYVIGIFNLTKG
jgi:hypothetical protein